MTTWDEMFAPRPPVGPTLKLLETCWRVRTPSGRVVSCGIYADNAPGLEVRAGFSEEDLLKSQRSAEIGSAREIAAEWKRAVVAKGCTEVPLTVPPS